MVLIPGGEFTMGTEADYAFSNESPPHRVTVSPFLLDVNAVTNDDFARFIESTGYLTVAERPVDWEEMKKQVPPGTPKPPDEVLAPGSLVFRPTEGPVDLRDMSQWWIWTTGASWRHPEGPASNLEGRGNHPVVHVAWEDAQAYAEGAGQRLPTLGNRSSVQSSGKRAVSVALMRPSPCAVCCPADHRRLRAMV